MPTQHLKQIPLLILTLLTISACSTNNPSTSTTTLSDPTDPTAISAPPEKPNFVVIFCDDLGYGDLGTFGHPTIKTPHLDRMATQGQKWTSFYVSSSVCTPSRAGLLTGRLPVRSGMASSKRRVLFPDSKGGLPQSEITIAKALKQKGYATAAVGKWHLGHLKPYLPTAHGFDAYYGIPYSNDMDRLRNAPRYERLDRFRPQSKHYNVPLMRNETIIERPADQTTITKRFTEESIKFIEQNKNQPFFLYLAHSLPHIPLFRSKEFENHSRRGIYGDVIEEIDWSVGQIIKTLHQHKLHENTLVVFTSDNGPWLIFNTHGGSAGILRDGKGATYEGGMREPTIFYWPGTIKPRVVADMGSTLDLLPTFVSLAGGTLPDDRTYDGYDLTPTLIHNQPSPRNHMIYYRGTEIYAARLGPHKAHYITQGAYGGPKKQSHNLPILYHLDHDPSEKYNVNQLYPNALKQIDQLIIDHKKTLKPVENQLEKR